MLTHFYLYGLVTTRLVYDLIKLLCKGMVQHPAAHSPAKSCVIAFVPFRTVITGTFAPRSFRPSWTSSCCFWWP